MCFGYESSSVSPAVNTTKQASPSTTTLKQSRRINPDELAHQVAQYVNQNGQTLSSDLDGAVGSMTKVLKKGSLKVTFEAQRLDEDDTGSSRVVVKQGRKVLLSANGNAALEFNGTTYTPGSWTKPFRAFDTSAIDAQ